MAKYLLKVSYSADGLKGVMKEGGTARTKAVERALAGVGGSLESFVLRVRQRRRLRESRTSPTMPRRWRWWPR